ncbi:MAG: hypothetical protein OEL54_04020, partial [Flavobacteriaceae bacterium]|nr:hypothetical protein [Flavobacteriaceae bacterium]
RNELYFGKFSFEEPKYFWDEYKKFTDPTSDKVYVIEINPDQHYKIYNFWIEDPSGYTYKTEGSIPDHIINNAKKLHVSTNKDFFKLTKILTIVPTHRYEFLLSIKRRISGDESYFKNVLNSLLDENMKNKIKNELIMIEKSKQKDKLMQIIKNIFKSDDKFDGDSYIEKIKLMTKTHGSKIPSHILFDIIVSNIMNEFPNIKISDQGFPEIFDELSFFLRNSSYVSGNQIFVQPYGFYIPEVDISHHQLLITRIDVHNKSIIVERFDPWVSEMHHSSPDSLYIYGEVKKILSDSIYEIDFEFIPGDETYLCEIGFQSAVELYCKKIFKELGQKEGWCMMLSMLYAFIRIRPEVKNISSFDLKEKLLSFAKEEDSCMIIETFIKNQVMKWWERNVIQNRSFQWLNTSLKISESDTMKILKIFKNDILGSDEIEQKLKKGKISEYLINTIMNHIEKQKIIEWYYNNFEEEEKYDNLLFSFLYGEFETLENLLSKMNYVFIKLRNDPQLSSYAERFFKLWKSKGKRKLL